VDGDLHVFLALHGSAKVDIFEIRGHQIAIVGGQDRTLLIRILAVVRSAAWVLTLPGKLTRSPPKVQQTHRDFSFLGGRQSSANAGGFASSWHGSDGNEVARGLIYSALNFCQRAPLLQRESPGHSATCSASRLKASCLGGGCWSGRLGSSCACWLGHGLVCIGNGSWVPHHC
jgi:hypothetical protein